MKYIYILLARLIREGKVRVDIPAVDMDSLERICYDHNGDILELVRGVVYDEENTPEKKIGILQEVLDEETEDI